MYEIPQSVTINGVEHPIRNRGDYRTILDCFEALTDTELSDQERTIAGLIIFYEDVNSIDDIDKLGDVKEAVSEMEKFFNCGQTESPGMSTSYKLIDWSRDSQLICSAINNVAKKEIRFEPYIHWWTFMGYYLAIGESPLSHIVGIRSKIAKGKPLDKAERLFRAENPQYFSWDSRTLKQKKADDIAKQLWNNGK